MFAGSDLFLRRGLLCVAPNLLKHRCQANSAARGFSCSLRAFYTQDTPTEKPKPKMEYMAKAPKCSRTKQTRRNRKGGTRDPEEGNSTYMKANLSEPREMFFGCYGNR